MGRHFDVLIIGSGAAGLTLALSLAPKCRIAVLAKRQMQEGSTYYAQGGIAAVDSPSDSVDSHITDTLIAGAGLSHPTVVEYVAEHGREALEDLIAFGVPFSRTDNHYHLTREGGHSHRRVFHAADATGKAIESTLLQQVTQHDNITLLENHIAIDLLTTAKFGMQGDRVLGAYVYDANNDRVDLYCSRFTVLATGGASKVYLYTSNPDLSTGDGIAMAWRAGCRVANLEFNQFHPTCLYHTQAKSFLITEAIRGEGGILLLENGERFMHRFDERAELAPRDIVARAIDHEMKRTGAQSVFLDISHKPAEFIQHHFPTVYNRCLEYGFDLTKQPIPVVPAAHYTCGGVMANLSGETDLHNLFAIGEVAFTGLHGANRMASNSLLECVVFGKSAAQTIMQRLDSTSVITDLPEWDESRVADSDEAVVVSHNWDELRRFMWDYVGIVRTTKRLQRARNRVELLTREIAEYYGHCRVSRDLLELRNLVQVADLIVQSALLRKESRGLHYTLDYPRKSATAVDTILAPPNCVQRGR